MRPGAVTGRRIKCLWYVHKKNNLIARFPNRFSLIFNSDLMDWNFKDNTYQHLFIFQTRIRYVLYTRRIYGQCNSFMFFNFFLSLSLVQIYIQPWLIISAIDVCIEEWFFHTWNNKSKLNMKFLNRYTLCSEASLKVRQAQRLLTRRKWFFLTLLAFQWDEKRFSD